MAEVFPPQKKPELFFAYVAPIGTDVEPSIKQLTEKLHNFGYAVIEIKITDVFAQFNAALDLPLTATPLEERFETHIAFGDALREKFSDDSFLAYTCIQQIIFARNEEMALLGREKPEAIAYVLRQFKRKEEIDLLRSIYGRLLFQISVHSERSSRVDNLSRKFASSHNSTAHNNYRDRAESLVAKDENELDRPHGQRVSDVFHEADFIVDSNTDEKALGEQMSRFVDLIFGSNSISPSKDEYGLYTAKSASLRSLDLSRQVGAAIFTKRGEIVALGANEVPKALGGTYWGDEKHDDRDFRRGEDSNEKRKREIFSELAEILAPGKSASELLSLPAVRRSQFMDALEYGRMIHAEMSAICDAARLGRTLKDTVLYSTTFPCHMCAKHIVAAGIEAVVFLEPYPKSLASDMHSDSINIEGQSRDKFESYPGVNFRHFCGVSPRRYRDLFEKRKRKNPDGTFAPWVSGEPQPIIDVRFPDHIHLELGHIKAVLQPALKQIGLQVSDLKPTSNPAVAARSK